MPEGATLPSSIPYYGLRALLACAFVMQRCARLCVFVAWRVFLRRSVVLGSFAGVFLVSLGLELFLVYVVHRFTALAANFWRIFSSFGCRVGLRFFFGELSSQHATPSLNQQQFGGWCSRLAVF